MVAGEDCIRGWQHLWNIVDVRGVAAAHALILENDVCSNGSRYQLPRLTRRCELTARQLQGDLQVLFPGFEIGDSPAGYGELIEKHGKSYDAPGPTARRPGGLGLETHAKEDTLRTTAETTRRSPVPDCAW